ncbi:hypothetical protein WN944_017283 [Citrus x changshan-huyou]|uniref:Uncharacterized protein n=1 Tax=Citrus x changshan-huyou TaxID=2935761 RepID=A0AAP0MB04_9ROSI
MLVLVISFYQWMKVVTKIADAESNLDISSCLQFHECYLLASLKTNVHNS